MSETRLSRRQFLQGCSAAIAALAGARLTNVALGAPEDNYNQDILVVVFLRGGWDALNVLLPIAGDDRGYYENARANLKIPTSGNGAAIAISSQFGLHPAMAPLYDLYQAKHLALVRAVGLLTAQTRSHFDAMQYIEMGTPGEKSTSQGWLTRHLLSAPNLPPTILTPAISTGGGLAASLWGSREAIAMTSPNSFSFNAPWGWGNDMRAALRKMYDGDHWLYESGSKTLDGLDVMETVKTNDYTPANGAVYPNNSFANNLKSVAQMIKLNLGLRAATVDLGGWDTHENQSGSLNTLLEQVAQGLAAFYLDLDGSGDQNYTSRLTIVVQSEFGRRLKENASRGTDHGYGNLMLVLGGAVNGGRMYGPWPGLHNDQLFDGADLRVRTDFRQVLSEILLRRLGNPNLPAVFPGYSGFTPLDIVQGPPIQNTYLPLVTR